jgi:hypothetical protein
VREKSISLNSPLNLIARAKTTPHFNKRRAPRDVIRRQYLRYLKITTHSSGKSGKLTTGLCAMEVGIQSFGAHLGDFFHLPVGDIVEQPPQIGASVQRL